MNIRTEKRCSLHRTGLVFAVMVDLWIAESLEDESEFA